MLMGQGSDGQRRWLGWLGWGLVGLLLGVSILLLAVFVWPATVVGVAALLLVQAIGLPLSIMVSAALGSVVLSLLVGLSLGVRGWWRRYRAGSEVGPEEKKSSAVREELRGAARAKRAGLGGISMKLHALWGALFSHNENDHSERPSGSKRVEKLPVSRAQDIAHFRKRHLVSATHVACLEVVDGEPGIESAIAALLRDCTVQRLLFSSDKHGVVPEIIRWIAPDNLSLLTRGEQGPLGEPELIPGLDAESEVLIHQLLVCERLLHRFQRREQSTQDEAGLRLLSQDIQQLAKQHMKFRSAELQALAERVEEKLQQEELRPVRVWQGKCNALAFRVLKIDRTSVAEEELRGIDQGRKQLLLELDQQVRAHCNGSGRDERLVAAIEKLKQDVNQFVSEPLKALQAKSGAHVTTKNTKNTYTMTDSEAHLKREKDGRAIMQGIFAREYDPKPEKAPIERQSIAAVSQESVAQYWQEMEHKFAELLRQIEEDRQRQIEQDRQMMKQEFAEQYRQLEQKLQEMMLARNPEASDPLPVAGSPAPPAVQGLNFIA